MTNALLEVNQLRVTLDTAQGAAVAIRQISLTLAAGQTMGLIGESGCGKSMTALALMGLLPDNAYVDGSIRLDGEELTTLAETDWQHLRGNRMAMIFQEPMSALNPVHRVVDQVAEPLRWHRHLGARAARIRAVELLDRVGIANAHKRARDWPHQFSGGERQRIVIATALACQPKLLIADEPTTALDASVQKQILALIEELVDEHKMALLLISHDLALIAQHVKKTAVMYGGTIVETGASSEIFSNPAHPYTRGLLAARPTVAQRMLADRKARLPTIAGTVPRLMDLPAGCPFAGRCPFTLPPNCTDIAAPDVTLSDTHSFKCHRADVVLSQKLP